MSKSKQLFILLSRGRNINITACFCQGHLPALVKQLLVNITELTRGNQLCHQGS